jgi:Tfp pilus assembly protein PilN
MNESAPRAARKLSWPVVLLCIVIVVAALIALIFLRLESWPARTASQGTAQLEKLGRDLRAAFVDVAHLQPRITIRTASI